ncbi:DUF1272 domain-containing protein [Microbacterium sediminis]|nr:DUF1272 domain-containing protein [Microbacterium sediminis]
MTVCQRCDGAEGPFLACSFACTWCAACVATFPDGRCPNCRGELNPV